MTKPSTIFIKPLGVIVLLFIPWVILSYFMQLFIGRLFIWSVVEGQTWHSQAYFWISVGLSWLFAFLLVRWLKYPWLNFISQRAAWVRRVSRNFSGFLPTGVLTIIIYNVITWLSVKSWNFFGYHHDTWVLLTDIISGVLCFAGLRWVVEFWDRRRS